jgi:hypothetical protein
MNAKYSFESLQKYCNENGIELCRDYSQEVVRRETKIEGKCKNKDCNELFNKSLKQIIHKNAYYCKKCTYNNAKIKRKETCLEKYGVEYARNAEQVKHKCDIVTKYNYNLLQTFLQENANVKVVKDYSNERIYANYKLEILCTNTNCSQLISREFYKIIKLRTLCINCSRINAKEIRKQTNIKLIGCENFFQSNDIKAKIKKTNLEKYGVEYCIQHIEIAKKTLASGVRFKDYAFPSGRIEKIQGYENIALDELINIELINENDIVVGCKNVPTIWYTTDDGVKHRHYVDIFIQTQNRCIEVKGEWFYIRDKHKLKLKKQEAENLGYKYELWVYNKQKEKINCNE